MYKTKCFRCSCYHILKNKHIHTILYDIVECRLHILTVVEVHLLHNSDSLMALILLLEFYQSQKSIMVSKMSFYNFLLYLGLSLTLNLN